MPSPIHHLPPELLTLIFTLLLENDERSERNRTVLALVCQEWHQLVYQTPSLWATIHNPYSLPITTLALAISQPMPISVRFFLTGLEGAPVNEAFLEACHHFDRWRNAWLGLHHWKGSLDYLSAPAPLLETAYIHGPLWRDPVSFIDLFSGQAPRLKELRLDSLAIPWNVAMISDLTCLELSYLKTSAPTPTELLAILRASPMLSTLKLHFMHFQVPPSEPSPPVDLNCLQHLTLTDIDAHVIGYLLSLIHCPPQRQLDVKCELVHEDDLKHFVHLPDFLPSVQGEMTLKVGGRSIVYSDQETLTVEFTNASSLVILRHLISILPNRFLTSDTKLHFDAWSDPNLINFLAVVDAVQAVHVTTLDFRIHEVGLDRLLEHLSTTHDGHWSLPALRELEVDLEDVPAGILPKMVEARSGGTAPIEKITVLHGQAGDRTELERLIGEENVVWKVDRQRRRRFSDGFCGGSGSESDY